MKRQITDKLFIALLFIAPFAFMACGNNTDADNNDAGTDTVNTGLNYADTAQKAQNAQSAVATLSGTKPDTTVNGTVRFTQEGDQVRMDLQISVPKKANQSVAMHIHEHGDCGDMGKHAGGHWNPTNENHGKWGEGAFHSGDIGNIQLDGSGNGSLQLTSNRWSIGGDARTNVLNKTIIVHAGVDDYTSQPAGNSGERIGCGVIQQANQ